MVLKAVKEKIKFAHRNMTPKEQRGSIGTAPHIPELGTKGVLVVNSTPVSLYPRKGPWYRVAHEKPARRLVEQRGRRSRTLYRKLNKCKCKVLTG